MADMIGLLSCGRALLSRLSPDGMEIRRLLRKHLPDDLRGVALDLGAGHAPYRRDIQGICPQLSILPYDLTGHPEIAVVGNMESLPFKDGCASLIVMFESLQYPFDTHAVLNECRRVCAPGAWIAVSYPFLYPESPEPSRYRWTSAGMAALLHRHGFTVVAEEIRGGPLMLGITTLGNILIRCVPGWHRIATTSEGWERRIRVIANAVLQAPFYLLGQILLPLDRLIARPAYYVGGIVFARAPDA